MSHDHQFIDPAPIETCAGLFEIEINTMDVVHFPDAWMRDKSGLYIYKPGLKETATEFDFASHEAGTLFSELVRFLLRSSGNEPIGHLSLGDWGEVRTSPRENYRTMYLLGASAIEEIIIEESLGAKMSNRRQQLLETHLFFLRLEAEEAQMQSRLRQRSA